MKVTRGLEKRKLGEVIKAQPDWFSEGNRKFFNDRSYYVRYAKKTGDAFLIRSTYAWTDMFDRPKRLHYRINPLNQETLKVLPLVDESFNSWGEVYNWLKEN